MLMGALFRPIYKYWPLISIVVGNLGYSGIVRVASLTPYYYNIKYLPFDLSVRDQVNLVMYTINTHRLYVVFVLYT